jgi:hypothetical protein
LTGRPILGHTVTVEGWAAAAQPVGAVLLADANGTGRLIWLDRARWPDECYSAPGPGRRVRVTGTVATRSDMPAWLVPIHRPGGLDLAPAGVVAHSADDYESLKWRFDGYHLDSAGLTPPNPSVHRTAAATSDRVDNVTEPPRPVTL